MHKYSIDVQLPTYTDNKYVVQSIPGLTLFYIILAYTYTKYWRLDIYDVLRWQRAANFEDNFCTSLNPIFVIQKMVKDTYIMENTIFCLQTTIRSSSPVIMDIQLVKLLRGLLSKNVFENCELNKLKLKLKKKLAETN